MCACACMGGCTCPCVCVCVCVCACAHVFVMRACVSVYVCKDQVGATESMVHICSYTYLVYLVLCISRGWKY